MPRFVGRSSGEGGVAIVPDATTSSKGVIQVGSGLSVTNGVLSADAVSAVTSVGLSVPDFLSVSGSPITSSGTLEVSAVNQTANTILAGPATGNSTAPTFRALVAADIPNLDADKITTGTLAPARLPVATGLDLGAIKIGTGLTLTSGVASVDLATTTITPNYVFAGPSTGSNNSTPTFRALVGTDLPVATASTLGAIKVGSGLTITDGVLSSDLSNNNTPVAPNRVLAGPSSGATSAAATFRALVGTDLPVATASTLGAIKIGTGLAISNGVLNADIDLNNTTTDVAPNKVLAGPSTGNINAIPSFRVLVGADLPIATSTTLGAIKVGTGLTITSGVLSADLDLNNTTTVVVANKVLAGPTSGSSAIATFRALVGTDLPVATASTLGAIKVGTGLSISAGVLNADVDLNNTTTVVAANRILAGPTSGSNTTPSFRALVGTDLPVATASTLGAIKVGSGLTITNGVLAASEQVFSYITSVGVSLPSIFTVSGSPITSAPGGGGGTITATLANQAANLVWAGPATGASTTPTFRSLVAADIPNLDTAKITTGTLDIARGGTGAGTKTAAFDALSPTTTLGDTIYSNGTNNVRLAGNTTTTKKFLTQTGTGTVSAAPVWSILDITDILAGPLPVAQGGTGLGSYTAGSLLYASDTTTISQISNTSGGVMYGGTSAPAFTSTADLTWDNTNKRLGIGVASPGAFLEIKAGTATVAPLKLTAGTNLTSAVAGSIEFDGTNLFITDSGLTRKTLAFTDSNSSGTAENVSGIVGIANGGTGASTASTARTNLGATTVGSNFFTLANPSAIRFVQVNADNTVSMLDASSFRTAIGASSGGGTGGGDMTNPMTTVGDMIYASDTGTPSTATRLGLTPGGVMYGGASAPAWTAAADLTWDNTNKRLGIGQSTPSTVLDIVHTVAGNAAVNFTNASTNASANARFILNNSTTSGGLQLRSATHATEASDILLYSSANNIRFYTNGNARVSILSGGNVGIGTASPTNPFHVTSTITSPTAANLAYLSSTITPASSTSAGYIGQYNLIRDTGANATGTLTAIYGESYHGGSAVLTWLRGLSVAVGSNGTGNITSAAGLFVFSPVQGSTGAFTTSYAAYLGAQTVTGVTTGYGVYAAGASDYNYFAGRVGIGATTPGALLQLAAGTASVAPLRLTTGINLTSPVAGSVEFDGTSLFLTNSSVARKTVAYTDSTMTGVWNGTAISPTYGGTGQTSYTDGQLLIGNSTGNTLTKATLTAGTGITITNGNGSITISSTGGSGSNANEITFTAYQTSLTSTTVAARIDDVNNLSNRIYTVENIGYYAVYLGSDNTVSSTTGFRLEPGDIFETVLTSGGALWGVTDFGTVKLSVLRGV